MVNAQEVIAQALALSEAATAAPWVQNGMNGVHTPVGSCIATTHRHVDEQRKANAEFIAAARTLLPALAKALGDVLALADDLDERGRPGAGDSALDAASRRQIREDVKRLRATITAALSEVTP